MDSLESIHSIQTVVLVVHLILAITIIGLVLLQRSEGGGLGIGNSGGIGNFASAKGTANALTRMTAIAAMGFFVTSLSLGILAAKQSTVSRGILEQVDPETLEKAQKEEETPAPESSTISFTPPAQMPAVAPTEENAEEIAAPIAGQQKKVPETNQKTAEPLKDKEETKDKPAGKTSEEKPSDKTDTPAPATDKNSEDKPATPSDTTDSHKD